MTDKTIRFNVDSREVQDYQSKMREQAQRMAVDMVNYARSQTASAKETLKILEDQIRAIEKRNKLDQEMAKDVARQQFQAGRLTPTEFGKANQQIDTQFGQESLQIRLLRELIEVQRQTSREEIRSDRENVERGIREGFGENEIDNLRQIIAQTELEGQRQPQQSGGLAGGLSSSGGVGQLATGFMTGNLGSVVSGLATVLGAGAMVGVLGALAINTTRQYEQGVLSYAVANQRGVTDILSSGDFKALRSSELGMGSMDMAQRIATMMRSYGGAMDLGTSKGLIGAGISRGISDQSIDSLLNVSRFTGSSAIGTISGFEEYLKETSKPLIRLPELLDVYLRKSDEILQRGGVLNTEGLRSTIMSISSSYGVEGFNLNRMMNSMAAAAGPGGSPIAEAIKLQTLKEMFPEKDMWERYGIMEHAAENPEYMKAYFRNIKGFTKSAGRSGQGFGLMASTGMGYDDINRLMSGDLDIQKVSKISGKTQEEVDNELSKQYVEASKEMIGSLSKMMTDMSAMKDAVVQLVSSVPEVVKNINANHEEQVIAINNLRRSNYYTPIIE